MDATYRIPLSVLIKEHKLEEVYLPAPAKDISIYNPEVDRPALALSGFYERFEASRIQLIGQAEHGFGECVAQKVEHSAQFRLNLFLRGCGRLFFLVHLDDFLVCYGDRRRSFPIQGSYSSYWCRLCFLQPQCKEGVARDRRLKTAEESIIDPD